MSFSPSYLQTVPYQFSYVESICFELPKHFSAFADNPVFRDGRDHFNAHFFPPVLLFKTTNCIHPNRYAKLFQYMWKSRILAVLFIILGILAGYFDIAGHFAFTPDFLKREFSLGPDLQGGISLEYKADTSSIPDSERSEAMAGLRDIIETRVILFGVSEPIIQVKKRGDEDRLIVELAGVFDVNNAIKIIGETPYLEFQTLKTGVTIEDLQKKQDAQDFVGVLNSFEATKLTGRFLQKARLEYDQTTLESTVGLEYRFL